MNIDILLCEVNADLLDARKKLEKAKGKQPEKPKEDKPKGGAFKKIQIQEESESEEEDDKSKKPLQSKAPETTATQTKMDKMIDKLLIEEQKNNIPEKLNKINSIKEAGTQLIKDGQYEKAIKEFEQGLNILNNIILSGASTNSADLNNQKATLFNNIGLCYMQMDMPTKVIEFTSRVAELKDINQDVLVKALIRRGNSFLYA